MPEIKGERLHVNLGASQVRKRLKGHGFGVRKVHSTGRQRSVIIHTATGDHLRDLRALFHDVLEDEPAGAGKESPDPPVHQLKNIGPVSAGWLREIDVYRRSDLQRLGPALAYRLIRERNSRCGRNLLWALAGALLDIDWRELPLKTRRRLLREAETP